MNAIWTDREILDRVEQDVRTTLGFLKARTLAAYADVQTVGRGVIQEEAGKDLDGYLEAILNDVVAHWRAKLPEDDQYRADRIDADRALAAAE